MICPPIVAPYRLGSLCKRGHDHASTGKSRRYPSGHCVVCDNARCAAKDIRAKRAAGERWRKRWPEKARSRSREYNRSHPDKRRRRVNAWRASNRPHARELSRRSRRQEVVVAVPPEFREERAKIYDLNSAKFLAQKKHKR